MTFFKRNIITTILLLPYFYGWYYVVDWFTSEHSKYQNSCGAANVGMLMLLLLILAIYSLTMLINVIFRKGQSRSDYVKFLLIVILPVVLLYVGTTVYNVFSNHNPLEANLQNLK
jgi:uncharacterized membrane protein YqjE